MSLGSERAEYEEALKKIVDCDWLSGDEDAYYCKYCNKIYRETKTGFLVNHFDHCPLYIAKKVLDKNR